MLIFRTGSWLENVSVLFNFKAFLNILVPAHSLNTVAMFQHILQPLGMRSKRSLRRLHANIRCINCKEDIFFKRRTSEARSPNLYEKSKTAAIRGPHLVPTNFTHSVHMFIVKEVLLCSFRFLSTTTMPLFLFCGFLPTMPFFILCGILLTMALMVRRFVISLCFFLQPVNGDLAPRHYYDYYYIPTGEGTMTIGCRVGGAHGPVPYIYIYISKTCMPSL